MHRGTYGGNPAQSGSDLIGRGDELERLHATFERARSAEGGVVVLWGSAGVGKTRLLEEFLSRAETAGARVSMAGCFEYLRPPFGPFDDLFRLLGLPDAELADAAAADPASAKNARFRHVVRGLCDAAQTAPLLVAIDDAQWADLASLEMLAFAARALRDAPVLVVATVRSDDIERDASRFELVEKLRKDAIASLDLQALSDADARRLIARLAAPEKLDAIRIARICELAEGRPYFIEELVRAAMSTPHTDVETPPSIRSSVLARFMQLSPEDRRIVERAAAIGRRFGSALLADLARVPPERVWEALTAARALQLVRDGGDNEEIAFHHAITREVIYREMLTAQARAIHGEIAALFERSRTPVDAGELAHHWRAAGNALRAATYYEHAGDAAYERNAYHDACAAYRCALGSPDDATQDRASLCARYARTLSICGDGAGAIEWCAKAVDAYVSRGDAPQAARYALWLARRQYDFGETVAAMETARWALEILGANGDRITCYDAHVTLASFEALQGRTAAAAIHLVSAESLEAQQSAIARSGFHTVRAMVRATDRALRLAFSDYARAIEFARASGKVEQLAWSLNNFASRAAETGHLDAAMPAYAEAIACAEAANLVKTAAVARQGCAFAHLLAGDVDAALAMRERGLGMTSGNVLLDSIAAAVALRVIFLCGHGDDSGAAMILDRAFASGETQVIGLLAGSLAPLLDAAGRRAEAKGLRERALAQLTGVISSLWLLDQCASDDAMSTPARALLVDAARDDDNRAAVAHLRLFDARVARRRGNVSEAKSRARDAAERFGAMAWPWEEGQAHEVAGKPAQALALYERFGFAREVQRLAEARRRARHRPHSGGLTPREIDVARLAASGMSNRLIGETLFISQRTVEAHIASVFDRFDLTSRVQLVDLLASLGCE